MGPIVGVKGPPAPGASARGAIGGCGGWGGGVGGVVWWGWGGGDWTTLGVCAWASVTAARRLFRDLSRRPYSGWGVS